jgi:hypothetical protein
MKSMTNKVTSFTDKQLILSLMEAAATAAATAVTTTSTERQIVLN